MVYTNNSHLCWLKPTVRRLTISRLSLIMIGFLQLAGGTNAHTVTGLKKHGLFQVKSLPGILI